MAIDLPIYPKARDLIIVVDTIDEVMGGGAGSILFRIGEKMGKRYAMDILRSSKNIGMGNTSNFLQFALKNLIASDWYSSVVVTENSDGIDIEITEPFELESQRKNCDFLRGFISGLYVTISGSKCISDEEAKPLKKRTIIRLRDLE